VNLPIAHRRKIQREDAKHIATDRLAQRERVNRARSALQKNYRKFDAIFTTGESQRACMSRCNIFGEQIRALSCGSMA
jgi:hypothetical protein